MQAAISPKTKVLILNSPHNPTGKIFSRDEMTQIAEICNRYEDLIVISDEVYEHIIFKGKKIIDYDQQLYLLLTYWLFVSMVIN